MIRIISLGSFGAYPQLSNGSRVYIFRYTGMGTFLIFRTESENRLNVFNADWGSSGKPRVLELEEFIKGYQP